MPNRSSQENKTFFDFSFLFSTLSTAPIVPTALTARSTYGDRVYVCGTYGGRVTWSRHLVVSRGHVT
jgi:hypothetical protein